MTDEETRDFLRRRDPWLWSILGDGLDLLPYRCTSIRSGEEPLIVLVPEEPRNDARPTT